ncbi:phytanoyl-CoA dioxygenase family protein [Ekhidna sp.]|jgi:ectoine hydroxylase|uniref:phytanoyl-CoA dioxygenase family protein n=1 Tax=Ekhidna sp. TaxID=2608089 RepID=UPI0032EEB629
MNQTEKSQTIKNEELSAYKVKYDAEGFLLLDSFLSKHEISVIVDEIPQIKKIDPNAVIFEKSGEVRSIFVEVEKNSVIDAIVQNNDLIAIVSELIGSEVYPYQIKFNNKCAFLGEPWEWHQDFVFWHKEDGMPEPDALTVAIFLGDIHEYNGPMYLVPASHKAGLLSFQQYDSNLNDESDAFKEYQNSKPYISQLSSKLKYVLEEETIKKNIRENGVLSAKGAAGTLLFFHSNLIHASPSNLSPWDRNILFISYNSIKNHPPIELMKRPSFIANKSGSFHQLS